MVIYIFYLFKKSRTNFMDFVHLELKDFAWVSY